MAIVGKKGQAQDWKDNRQAVARTLQTYDVADPGTEPGQCIIENDQGQAR